MDPMGGIEVPDNLSEIIQVDVCNEEYQKIMGLFQPERSKREDLMCDCCKENEKRIDDDLCESCRSLEQYHQLTH